MIGTEDVSRHWQETLRLQRRTEGWLIHADQYYTQPDFMQLIISRILEYQWQTRELLVTTELTDTMYEESMGSIDLLILLWMMVQFEVAAAKRTGNYGSLHTENCTGEIRANEETAYEIS
ncbi:MAG: hypothetical protein ACLSEY_13605 [Enterocloster sp.]